MLKKSRKWILGGLRRHMSIAKRITLLYGGIFSLSLLFLSVFITWNITGLQQNNMRRQLTDTVTNIQKHLEAGEEFNEDTLAQLLDNKYVEVSVYSLAENRAYNNFVGETPPFIRQSGPLPPKEEIYGDEDDDGEEDDDDDEEDEDDDEEDEDDDDDDRRPDAVWTTEILEGDFGRGGFRVDAKRENGGEVTEYILKNRYNQQFMLISDDYITKTGAYQIQAFRMIEGSGELLRNFIMKLAIVDLIGIFCAFLIGASISKRILQPVETIRSAAERITIEDLSQRISTEGPDDEMKELTITFNSMIDRLERAFQRQNQFISDASHELRTPIAVVQGYANLINRWGKSDPAVLQESVDSILTETEHMNALIGQLLFLAKGTQYKAGTQMTEISLNEVAAEFVRDLQVVEEKRNIIFLEEDDVHIFADYALIKQLLWVHGENALKYSEDDGEITVRVWKDKKYGYVSVRDNGIGIAPEDIPKIFDRFYRVDQSRSKKISGTGLGLSIARWIIDCHKGEIQVESKLGEGTVFINRFLLFLPEEKPDGKNTAKSEINHKT